MDDKLEQDLQILLKICMSKNKEKSFKKILFIFMEIFIIL